MGEDYPYRAEHQAQIASLIQMLENLTARDPEREVQGIALSVLTAVIESMRSVRPDDRIVGELGRIVSPDRLARGDPIRAADALLVARHLFDMLDVRAQRLSEYQGRYRKYQRKGAGEDYRRSGWPQEQWRRDERPSSEQEDMERAVPNQDPPEGVLPPTVEAGIRAEFEDLRGPWQRSALWTAALQIAFERSGLWSAIPGFSFATSGIAFAATPSERPSLAIFVYAEAEVRSPHGRFGSLAVGDLEFPVFVRRPPRSPIDHTSVPAYIQPSQSPYGGTATCWAEVKNASSPDSRIRLGILTAAHVLHKAAVLKQPAQVGHMVHMIDEWGSGKKLQGEVLAIGSALVDAGVVRPEHAVLREGSSLRVRGYVANGEPVAVYGNVTRLLTKIVEVFVPRGMISPDVQNLLFLKQPGQQGDSGALVVSLLDGASIGLYLGDFPTSSDETEGRCVLLAQAQQVLNILCLRSSQ